MSVLTGFVLDALVSGTEREARLSQKNLLVKLSRIDARGFQS